MGNAALASHDATGFVGGNLFSPEELCVPRTDIASGVPLRLLTRLLADMQTTINAAGLRAFDGDMDRFVIFALVLREGLPGQAGARPISAHSLSTSLGRSFETVRRHVNGLIASGYCMRVRGGVVATPDVMIRPAMRDLFILSHDSFVRFVEDLTAIGGMPAMPPAAAAYDSAIGINGAVDTMLVTVDTNQGLHGDWLDLVLFSTILCANAQRYARDPAVVTGDPLDERHAVRPSVIARALGLSETTVRRRIARLVVDGGPLVQLRRGLMVSQDWLATPRAAETTAATLAGVRRELRKAVTRGFPIHAPATAYIDGRPPMPIFA
ncbi:MAG: hypothetical protein V4537_06820 [Pseudomonadota bacterium]